MFDPTVFDNIKVAFENQIYDLDNLSGQIRITNRIDRLEMSIMSREFALQFQLINQENVTAEIRLEASLKDLAAEILELQGEAPACTLILRFNLQIQEVSEQCKRVLEIMQRIWNPEEPPTQTLSFAYGQEITAYTNTVEMRFNRQINEDQMEDIPNLIEHVLQTLDELGAI
ncbi:hypothetical protein [Cohnella luojiensis]|uniref:Group-specific protein n=1 Tax=Cohnella luojiensis TaxID=652876 RepID=A0A4Y8LZV2_9BACL|nr:hypothetical protein [Cohnella luojiensis]TFE26973.1 hypothetical protein E2980_10785 [Cohnella luojiensis]